MAAVLRFESGRHYCILCPSNTASHVSGHYRALTEKEKSDHGERITILKATVKRAFKVCQSCHNNSTCSRTNEVVPHWDMEHSSTPEKRPTSTFQTPDKLPVPSPVLFPSPSLAGPSTPQKSKSVHSSPTVESPAKRRKSTTASTSELPFSYMYVHKSQQLLKCTPPSRVITRSILGGQPRLGGHV